MNRVQDKVAIITGAGSGMGKADAIRLAEEGAKVVLTDIDLNTVKSVAEGIGNNAIYMQHDVTNEKQWQQVVDTTVKTFGGVHILVNNAGILQFASIADTSLELWRKIHAVNAEGPFLGCKTVLPAMEKSGGGSIINMSSLASKQGMNFAIAYSASKGAVESLTRSVAMHCKQQQNNIRCNSIHPDGVITPMVTDVTFGTREASTEQIETLKPVMALPEEVAAMVLYLATNEARFVNGAHFLIDNCSSITPPIGV